MILSHRHRFAFVHIYKTAGEAVTEALFPYLGPDDVVLGSWRMGPLQGLYYNFKLGVFKHGPAGQIRDFAGAEIWQSYFTFSFVRHPVDRARSLYKFMAMMLERRRRWTPYNCCQFLPYFRRKDPLRWTGMRAYQETSSFSEFIRHPGFLRDYGALSQCDMLLDTDGRLLVDFVGHYERLEQDFAYVVERIGLGNVTLPRFNVSSTKQRNSRLEDLVVTKEDAALLREIYARDFEVFGFDRSDEFA